MKNKIKYATIFLFVFVLGIITINLYQPNKEQPLKGSIEVIAYDNSYDYLLECSERFMELNPKTTISVKKIYSSDEILEQVDENNNKVTYIAQMSRKDFDMLGLEKNNYLEGQQDILNTYSKNFAQYRLEQIKYDDIFIGIPFMSRPLAFYVREDMLEQYGYSRDEMNTWSDVIRIGKDIYEKSNGQVKIINATGQDYDDLVSLLIMQYMNKNLKKEEIKSQVDNMLNELNNNNILNLNDDGEFLGRISSINAMKEIAAIEVKCKWIVENVPGISPGANKFFSAEGDNLVVLNNIDENKKLVEKFITYIVTNNSDAVKYVLQGDFFSSYLYTYKNKDIEFIPNNFIGSSPLVVLSNIEEKAANISDYSKYLEIKESIVNSVDS